MSEERAQVGRKPPRRLALGFAIAALLASWNPIAAPFGLIVGAAAILLSIRALRRSSERRRLPAVALGMGVLAVVASIVVLGLTAGAVGIELPGEPIVKGRTRAELDEVLARAAERTRAQRERASRELGSAAETGRGGAPRSSAKDGGGTPGAGSGDAP